MRVTRLHGYRFMTNFTITLDDEDLKQARIAAVQQG
jgi:hypothetical protein